MGGINSGRRVELRTVSPTLRALFEHANRRDIRLRTIADALSVDPQVLSNYTAGKNAPSILRVEEIAQALGGRLVFVPDDGRDMLEALGYVVDIQVRSASDA